MSDIGIGSKIRILNNNDGIQLSFVSKVYVVYEISHDFSTPRYYFRADRESWWVTPDNIEEYLVMNRNGANSWNLN